MTADIDMDARADVPHYEPSPYTRELDAERVVTAWQHTTRDTLVTMRHATPSLRTLTVIDVIYDIVQALRCRKED